MSQAGDSLLSTVVTDNIEAHHRAFTTAAPFRHVVIDEFLEPGFCRQLADQFPPFDDELARNEIGKVGGKCVHENVRELGAAYKRLDSFIHSRGFLSAIEQITGIEDLRSDPSYIGGGTHENRTGQGLDPHVDFNYHPGTRDHRRLNLILYLNDGWDEAWGGSIQLHSNPWVPDADTVKSVVPLLNRCVLFETSEHSWHGFEPVTAGTNQAELSRRSFAIYLYTKSRPEEEIVAPHGTFYVHSPLPPHLAPGTTLTETDYAALQNLVLRRNEWMRQLYAKEIEYRGEIESLKERLRQGPFRWVYRVAAVMAPLGSRRRRLLDRLIGKA